MTTDHFADTKLGDRARGTDVSDAEVFEQALSVFHRYSTQNDETVRQLLDLGILPAGEDGQGAVLDIGAGQGHLPDLLQNLAGRLVLVEPNPHCVQSLRQRWDCVYPCAWDASVQAQLRRDFPAGFDLVTMSHMLYHLGGVDDIRDKIGLALGLLKPSGHLVIVLNQPDAPTVRIGVGFMRSRGRLAEAAANEQLHRFCHEVDFYRALGGAPTDVLVRPMDCPLREVPDRTTLTTLLRMPLIDPGSGTVCDLTAIDAWIGNFIDADHPGLSYPATIEGRDELIVLCWPSQ